MSVLFFNLSFAKEPITPIVAPAHLNKEKIALGKALFFDERLSKNNEISCASCHQLTTNGADDKAPSDGVEGQKTTAKTPTVYNAVFNIRQTWSGARIDLFDQVDAPITNPKEHGTTWAKVIAKLSADKELAAKFKRVYHSPISQQNIQHAIAEFEQSLVTTNAPFDRWLQGDQNAIDRKTKQGYRLFKSYGCISCHQGRNVGGNMFSKIGHFGDYFQDRGGEITETDLGRYMVTKNPYDKHVFKVPSLRLSSLQTHFFHDGSQNDLSDAIRVMAKYQLGRSIPEQDIQSIRAFLASLVGHHPELTSPYEAE
jgi:cytochrome c peroxidase